MGRGIYEKMRNGIFKRRGVRIAVIIFIVTAVLIIAAALYIRLNPVFGGAPDKYDKEDYSRRAVNYQDGRFFYPKEYLLEGLSEDNRVSEKGTRPESELPCVNPVFTEDNDTSKLYVTWLGHSTLVLRMHGKNILIDPVFADRASPVSFAGPVRFAEPAVSPDELSPIDILILSHDHYDHLDMETIKELDSKTGLFIVPLGVEKHLERWGVSPDKIMNLAWWEEYNSDGLNIVCAPARHYSGRYGLDSGRTLFASWIFYDEYHKVYESGDTGFGGHFEDIHSRYGDFDFVMTDCAQYDEKWHASHMYPEEAAQACDILGAELAMPIHWGAYSLSSHGWDDPPSRFVKAAEGYDIPVVTPLPGETMDIDNYGEYTEKWWEDIE